MIGINSNMFKIIDFYDGYYNKLVYKNKKFVKNNSIALYIFFQEKVDYGEYDIKFCDRIGGGMCIFYFSKFSKIFKFLNSKSVLAFGIPFFIEYFDKFYFIKYFFDVTIGKILNLVKLVFYYKFLVFYVKINFIKFNFFYLHNVNYKSNIG